MTNKDTVEAIKKLKDSSYSYSQMAKMLGLSYPTVKKYACDPNPKVEKKSHSHTFKISKLIEPFLGEIKHSINSGITNNTKIFNLVVSNGYRGSYQLLNNYVTELRDAERVKKIRSYFFVDSKPGEQAQVDWGHLGKIDINGMKVNLYVFVIVLSYSRKLYAYCVTNQKQRTLQDCHMQAFKYFGGIPQKIRYDNMKTVITGRTNHTGEERIILNFEFKNFAKHYKFEPDICHPYAPWTKGKVESMVKYIKYNFFNGEKFGKTFFSLEEINEKLSQWLDKTANKRFHPIRDLPIEQLWLEEKSSLKDVYGYAPYVNYIPEIRRVSRISMVHYKRSSYWVSSEYAGRKIEIREVVRGKDVYIEFHDRENKITEYPLAQPGSWIVPTEREVIKNNSKVSEIRQRIMNNPIYQTKVIPRGISYYAEFLDNTK